MEQFPVTSEMQIFRCYSPVQPLRWRCLLRFSISRMTCTVTCNSLESFVPSVCRLRRMYVDYEPQRSKLTIPLWAPCSSPCHENFHDLMVAESSLIRVRFPGLSSIVPLRVVWSFGIRFEYGHIFCYRSCERIGTYGMWKMQFEGSTMCDTDIWIHQVSSKTSYTIERKTMSGNMYLNLK